MIKMNKKYALFTMNKLIIAIALLAMVGIAQAACNDCVLQVVPVANNICQGEPAVYDITITNVYDQPKAITLSAAGDITLRSDMPSQIVVGSYETQTVRVSFTPTQASIGQHRISVTATGYGADDSDDAIFTVNDCYAVDVSIAQPEIRLCEAAVGRLDFTVRNNGQKQDTYSISVSGIPSTLGVSFVDGQMSLAPGASRTSSLTITAKGKVYGDYELQLNAVSPTESYSKKFKVSLTNCYYSSVTAPAVFETCPAAGLTYTVAVKNSGCAQDNYVLALSGDCRARLNTNTIMLGPGETKDVAVTLDSVIGSCEAILTATSQFTSDSASTAVTIKDCYAVDLEVVPGELTACRGEPATFDLKATNIGYYADTFDLKLYGMDVNLSRTSLKLSSGETDSVPLIVTGTWCVIKDELPFTVTVIGKSSDKDTGLLRLRSGGAECAALNMTPAQSPVDLSCQGDAFTFYVSNTGYTEQTITLTTTGPESYLLQPTQLTLKPYESMPVALYIMPSDMTPREPYSIMVIADSGLKKAYLELNVDMVSPSCSVTRPALFVSEPVLPALNITEVEANGTATNATTTPTGAVAGGMESGSLLTIAGLLVVTAFGLFVLVAVTGRKPQQKMSFSEVSAPNAPLSAGQVPEKNGNAVERLTAIKEAISRSSK